MKRSKYSDEQILAIVKEGEAGRKVADLCRTHGIAGSTRVLTLSSQHERLTIFASASLRTQIAVAQRPLIIGVAVLES